MKSGDEKDSAEGCSDGEYDSDAEAEAVEAEFRALMAAKNEGQVGLAQGNEAARIAKGLRINWMNMRDAKTGKLMWESGTWNEATMFTHEMKADVPREILDCDAVSREINFTSKHEIRAFRLEQRIYLHGVCIEEWFFEFGFVIPGSTNSWQQTIDSAGEGNMKSADELSGEVTFETSFFDGQTLLGRACVRVFYS